MNLATQQAMDGEQMHSLRTIAVNMLETAFLHGCTTGAVEVHRAQRVAAEFKADVAKAKAAKAAETKAKADKEAKSKAKAKKEAETKAKAMKVVKSKAMTMVTKKK